MIGFEFDGMKRMVKFILDKSKSLKYESKEILSNNIVQLSIFQSVVGTL